MTCTKPHPCGPPQNGSHRCACGRTVILSGWRWVHWPHVERATMISDTVVARQERHLRMVEAARTADERDNVTRAAAGMPPIRSIALTPEQTDALHAGSLDLADVLPPDPWAEILTGEGPRPPFWQGTIEVVVEALASATEGEWERLSDFGIRRKWYWPGRCEHDRWRTRCVPEETKRRADRERSDRKRRARRTG